MNTSLSKQTHLPGIKYPGYAVADNNIGWRTAEFLGAEYLRGDGGFKLHIGDKVIVHPSVRPDGSLSTAREPFEAEIVLRQMKWTDGSIGEHISRVIDSNYPENIKTMLIDAVLKANPADEVNEICTYVPGEHAAVMNEYLFLRLEFKSR